MHLTRRCAVSRRRRSILLTCFITSIVGGIAFGLTGDGPVRGVGPVDAPAPRYEPIHSPPPPADWVPSAPTGELVSLARAPVEANDKGSTFTDAGARLSPQGPNLLERQKLEMARRAIEASRAAGTLDVTPIDGVEGHATAADAESRLDLLHNLPGTPLQPDPAAAIGEMPSAQIPGSPELTPQERAKLEALREAGTPRSSDGKEGQQP